MAAQGLCWSGQQGRPPAAPIRTGDSPRAVPGHEVPQRKALLQMLPEIRGTAANSFSHPRHGYRQLVWATDPSLNSWSS